jgi:hypothetical protein
MAMDQRREALALLGDWVSMPRTHGEPAYVQFIPGAVRTALLCGNCELAQGVAASFETRLPFESHVQTVVRAYLAEAHGEHAAAAAGFADAAARWRASGIPYEEAQALLGRGRCLAALGKAEEAREPLSAAREICARLGAKPALEETDRLLDGLASASRP